jgi:hypothetical protein
MCEVRSRKNGQEQKKRKKSTVVSSKKEIDCDEPHLAPNEKTQPIQWTERPTSALVAVNSLWPPPPPTYLRKILNRPKKMNAVNTKVWPVWSNSPSCTSWPFCPLHGLRSTFFHLASNWVHHSPFLFAADHCTFFFLSLFLVLFLRFDLRHSYPTHLSTFTSIVPTLVHS